MKYKIIKFEGIDGLEEHVVIEKENDTLALIGVENWGAKGNFSKYGDLAKAYEDNLIKISDSYL
jgi:hypothetical protein